MFQGFSERTIDFLWNVRFNNNREWIAAHKQEYREDLLEPLKALANEVQTAMAERFPEELFCSHVSRIYRDARRAHGRPPLKEELWFSIFGGGDRSVNRPEFYFAVNPEGYNFGLGIWSATPTDMARFRQETMENPQKLTTLVKNFQKQDIFSLGGPDYAKSKGEVDPLIRPWFQKRSIYFDCTRAYDALVMSKDLVQELVADFTILLPIYQHFDAICCRGERT